jgi:hypothetical protein
VTAPGGFDARELFAALAQRDVEYITIGGIAIQAHGGQRLTQDLDIVIAASAENIARLSQALDDLDARILGPDGQRSRSAPSAPLLASSDQWHLITAHGALDVLTLPAHLGSNRSTTRPDKPVANAWPSVDPDSLPATNPAEHRNFRALPDIKAT